MLEENLKEKKFILSDFYEDLIGKTITVTHIYNPTDSSIRNGYTTGDVLYIDKDCIVLLVTTRNNKNEFVTEKIYFPTTGYVKFLISKN